MIVYKCDGKRFSNNAKCKSEYETKHADDFPKWLTISGAIINNLPDRQSNNYNGELHFCSKTCLDFFLFKNEHTQMSIKQNVILYLNEKGREKIIRIIMDNDSITEDDTINEDAATKIFESKLNKEGYKDSLINIITKYHEIFNDKLDCFENDYIDFCN